VEEAGSEREQRLLGLASTAPRTTRSKFCVSRSAKAFCNHNLIIPSAAYHILLLLLLLLSFLPGRALRNTRMLYNPLENVILTLYRSEAKRCLAIVAFLSQEAPDS
jgi:hypothetical protein